MQKKNLKIQKYAVRQVKKWQIITKSNFVFQIY